MQTFLEELAIVALLLHCLQALDVIKKALADPRVKAGRQYALWQRAQKICHGNNVWLRRRWKEFQDDPMSKVKDAPKVSLSYVFNGDSLVFKSN